MILLLIVPGNKLFENKLMEYSACYIFILFFFLFLLSFYFLIFFFFFLSLFFFQVSINWEAIAAKESKELEDEIENARTGGGAGRGSRK